MTRRELIGMGSVGAVAVAIGGYATLRRVGSAAGSEASAESFPVHYTDAEWRSKLAPASYQVLRQGGTETPFTSPLLTEHRPGVFACDGCDSALFQSSTKFDSHTGWPSFWEAMPDAVKKREDRSLAMSRTEVICTHCGGHLGHVFTDGPKPTGLRYCMNGVALKFQPATA